MVLTGDAGARRVHRQGSQDYFSEVTSQGKAEVHRRNDASAGVLPCPLSPLLNWEVLLAPQELACHMLLIPCGTWKSMSKRDRGRDIS